LLFLLRRPWRLRIFAGFLQEEEMKRAGLFLVRVVVLVAGIAVVGALYYSHRDYGALFQERRGHLTGVEVVQRGTDSLGERSWITLRSSSGLEVVCGARCPVPAGRRYPAVIVLGGKATGKDAVDYALEVKDVVVAAVDYPYEARPSYTVATFLRDVPALRTAMFEMFPSVMLVMDYLRTRPDVDSSRIVMLGYSFGAPFVPCVAAHERRFAAAAMVYGGGDLRSLIAHNVGRYQGGVVSASAGMLAGFLLGPVEPMKYAGKISPIPLVMINGTEDEQIPRENTERFFAAAGEPKVLRWIESRHVHPRNPELTRTILSTLSTELRRLGVLPDPPARRHFVR
jgi:dienelactone hydrolase